MKKVYIFLPTPFKYEGHDLAKLIEDFKLIDMYLVVYRLPHPYEGDLGRILRLQVSKLLKCDAAILSGIRGCISNNLATEEIIPNLRMVATACKMEIYNFESCLDAIKAKKEEMEEQEAKEDDKPTSDDIMKFLINALFGDCFDNKGEKNNETKFVCDGPFVRSIYPTSACGKCVCCCQCPDSAECKYLKGTDGK